MVYPAADEAGGASPQGDGLGAPAPRNADRLRGRRRLASRPRCPRPLGAAAVALVTAPCWSPVTSGHSPGSVALRHPPAKLAAALDVGAGGGRSGGGDVPAYPWAFPSRCSRRCPCASRCRSPQSLAHLLVPLYLVIAGGVVSFAIRGASRGSGGEPRASGRAPAAWRIARAVALPCPGGDACALCDPDRLSPTTSRTRSRTPPSSWFRSRCMFDAARRGALDAADPGLGAGRGGRAWPWCSPRVAFAEYAVRDLILSRGNLLESNQLHLYFRVNSLFYDPNIFGRDLALVLVALGAYLAWIAGQARWRSRRRRRLRRTARRTGLQLLDHRLRGSGGGTPGRRRPPVERARGRVAAAVRCPRCARRLSWSSAGPDETRPRADREHQQGSRAAGWTWSTGGSSLARDRPVWGWGSGSFGAAFSDHIERAETTVSHSEPVTVAAEQGVIGLDRLRRAAGLRPRDPAGRPGPALATAAWPRASSRSSSHSFGYAGFVIDPATWALSGIGLALRPGGPLERGGRASPPRRAIRTPRTSATP